MSNTIWFIIICLAIEGGLAYIFISFENYLKDFMTETIYIFTTVSVVLLLPLAIILMPFAILSKLAICDTFPFFKNMKRSILLYLTFLSFQSILLGFWFIYFVQKRGENEEYFMQYLPLFLIPSIILAMSPTYCLYKNIKKKESILLSGYTLAYTIYLLLSTVMILLHSEYHIFRSSNSDANLISLVIIWGVIAVLCVFYAVQYMKQPKQQSYTDYYKNVLSFQSFTKYKSLKYRFHTILICFIIFAMGIIATHYWDIIPFFTLPIAIILSLYAASKEFKMTTAKASFPYKIILPSILLSEIIVGSQYFIGKPKMIFVYCSAFFITALVFGHLIYKENLHKRILFSIRLLVFAMFIGIILPIVCLGYNIFNPSLSSIKRVWNGNISSDVRHIFFMTISDEIGNIGVMDYSEIIVNPQYQKIASTCSINADIATSVYPFRSILRELYQINYRGSGYYSEADDYDIISFYIVSNKSSSHSLKGLDFLKYENKYGLTYVDSWLSTYNSSQEKAFNILRTNNKCISEKDRNAAIIKLFIKELAKYTSNVSTYAFEHQGNKKIRIYDSDSEMGKILKTCYNDVTLKPLLNKNCDLSLQNIYLASINSGHLFACDKSRALADIVLDKLWNKLTNDSIDDTIVENRSYLYLLSGISKKAESLAKTSIAKNSLSINSVCNLCLALYVNRKISEMDTLLSHFKPSYTYMKSSNTSFYEKLLPKLSELEKFGIIKEKNVILNQVSSIIAEDMQRILHEKSDEELNHLAYEFARFSDFTFAITCIEKAIELNPKEANYYDSKGEILLMQGKEQEAVRMWEKTLSLNPDFLKTHNSKLHLLLMEKGLISDY